MLSRNFTPKRLRTLARPTLALLLVLTLPAIAPAAQQSATAERPDESAVTLPESAILRAALTATGRSSLRAQVSHDSAIIKELVYGQDQQADPGAPGSGRETYELSLLDAVELALRNNLTVQIQRYNPENSYEGIDAARAQFDTNLTFQIPQTFSRSVTGQTVQTAGADVITSESFRGGFTWSENLEWGTNYSIGWNGSRSVNNNQFNTFNPTLTSGLNFTINQPLLRNFGDVNRTGIYVAMNSYESSKEGFRGQVQQIIFNAVNAYWQLRAAIEQIGVRQQALDLAEEQLARNNIQVEIGTLAPIETVQAETQTENARLQLINSQLQLENAQDALKQLINFDSVVDDSFAYNIVPTDEAESTVAPIDVVQAIEVALANDPALIQQRINVRNSELSLDQARNALLPNLSISAGMNLTGRGGDRIIRGGLGGDVSEIQEAGFTTALAQVFSGDFNAWNIGLNLTFPLHNYSARAGAARASISERQARTSLDQRIQAVTYAVRQQVRTVENLARQVQSATLSRQLAERQLNAEQRKFEVGTSTNFQVLTFQNTFSNSQLSELTASLSLQQAIAQLEQVKGTLLQSLGVTIEDAGSGGGRR